jgi:multidrug efflux pump subunit AcrB
VRRLRGGSGERPERMRVAVQEMLRPLAGSSASTVIIFVPLAFLGGVTGAFFKALAATMACALLVSFLVAWLAVPLLADHLLGAGDADREEGGPLRRRLDGLHRALLGRALAHPGWLVVGVSMLVGGGYLAYRQVGSGFMPAIDEGGFVLDYWAPPGTSLTETDRLLRQVEAILAATPEVETYSRRTGAQLGGGITEANQGDFFIRLKPLPRRPIDGVMAEVRRRVERDVPGLTVETAQLMEDLIGDLTAVPQPIEVKLYGDDPRQLLSLAPGVAEAIGKVDGVVEVRDGIVLAGDALAVRVDRTKAALEGVDPAAVARQLDASLSGVVTTHVQRGIRSIGIRVWIPQALRSTIEQIRELRLRAADGHTFPLRRIAAIDRLTGQPQITRENLKRMVAVTARISGRDLGSAVRAVQAVLSRDGLIPRGVYYEIGGLYQQQQIAFRGLMAVFLAAVALVFVLLLFLYERFRIALAILGMPLLAVCAVFIGLWATDTELNISAMMGMTMVVGIVTEVAIFYFSEFQDLRGAYPVAEALVLAGINRRRPIAMTTLAAILALLPLALALGQGAAMQQPLAIAIISGLVVQLPLVLLVMPVAYHEASKPRRERSSG